MNEQELRKMLRKEIKSVLSEGPSDITFLDKVGGSIRAKLGSNKQMLNKLLGGLNTDKLGALPQSQKVDLLVAIIGQFGLNAKDFNQVKARVSRKLGLAEPASEPTSESKLNELELDAPATDSKVSAGLSQRSERVKDTVAFKQMVKMLENKPATEQANFVLELLQGLPLDESAKRMLRMRIKTQLK